MYKAHSEEFNYTFHFSGSFSKELQKPNIKQVSSKYKNNRLELGYTYLYSPSLKDNDMLTSFDKD